MAVKKRNYVKNPFESTGERYDVSSNIYLTMIQSEAWQSLSKCQQVLYLYLKLQYYSQKRKPLKESKTAFYFNQTKWLNEYQLYSKGNKKGFYRDMTALIEKGFIKCISSGKTTREKNEYDYSNKWQLYRNDKPLIITSDEMNATLMHRMLKENDISK